MLRRIACGAAVALGALLGTGPAVAVAHPLLLQAAPQPGLVAPKPPAAIRLALSEPAVARGSEVVVTGPRGARVPVSAVRVSGRTVSVTPRGRLRSAVYRVRWSVLGDDGHLVRGDFSFGVAGAGGAAPPGAERLGGAAAGGRGGETATADGAVRVIGRWLGVLAASLLLGGFVLVALLRRRRAAEDGAAAVRGIAGPVWLVLGLAVVEGLVASATSGTGGDLDLGLLTAGATAKAELARAVVYVVVSLGLVAAAGREHGRDRLYAGGATAILLSYALSGHVLSEPTALALLDQAVHVLTAGLWLGGVLALTLVSARGGVRLAEGARAFAPVAGGALGLAIVTGVLAAVREVDRWYFLRWSDYGRVVLVKSALVALVALAGAVMFVRSRRGGRGREHPRVLRIEALGVVAVVALAAVLSGLAQGRGRPLPAERGTLFAGPAFATALLPDGGAQVLLTPARSGAGVVTVSLPPERRTARAVEVRLACACARRDVRVRLARHGGAEWSARVSLPSDGAWYGYVRVDGQAAAAPVQLAVGVPRAPGSTPLDVVAVADLSGPDAERCRAHVLGMGLAIARMNGAGGLDGGRKVASLVLDSGGSPARARALAARAAGRRPLAFAGLCGVGAADAARVAQRAGLPVVVGDPTVDPVGGPGVFQLAADPYAQGLAIAQLITQRVGERALPGASVIRTLVASGRLLDGLRAGLRGTGYRLVAIPRGSLAAASPARVASLLSRVRSAAVVVDGPAGGGADVAAIARAGRSVEGIVPGPVLLSERVLSERLIRSAGSLGRIGALQGVTEVSPTTADGILYRQAVPVLYRGELASLDGLRGYATGLALRDGVRDGIGVDAVRRALLRPSVFTSALLAPWSPRRPGLGSSSVVAVQPQFLGPTLVPAQAGGEAREPDFFPDGTWTVTSGRPLGLRPGQAGPPLG